VRLFALEMRSNERRARPPAVKAQRHMAGKVDHYQQNFAPSPSRYAASSAVRRNVTNKFDKDHPDRMRKKALELRERAIVTDIPGHAEQLIRGADGLENYALEVESRAEALGTRRNHER